MFITNISIENFRSIERVDVRLMPGLNVVVGENNVGKSSIFAAVRGAIASMSGTGNDLDDLRFGASQLDVECKLRLSSSEATMLVQAFPAPESEPHFTRFRSRLGGAIQSNPPTLQWSAGAAPRAVINVGEFWVHTNAVARSPELRNVTQGFVEFTNNFGARPDPDRAENAWQIGGLLAAVLSSLGLPNPFRVFEDFRARPTVGARRGVIESFDGVDTVNVLFGLKNHRDDAQAEKYRAIQRRFGEMFPSLRFEVYEPEPGKVDIKFQKRGHDFNIRLAKSGAGIAQTLTLLTNLLGREGYVFVIEEPETHLHAHAKRQLQRLIVDAAAKNQVVVITHDVHFAFSSPAPAQLIRVYVKNGATTVASFEREGPTNLLDPAQQSHAKLVAQIGTALKDLSAREMLFARAVLLVEDESQRNFFLRIAPRAGVDLDANGVSVVSVNGETGYAPFDALLKALAIPVVRVKDKPWAGDRQPPDYYSMGYAGIEIEDYLQQHGLGDMFQKAEEAVGKSKQRILTWVAENVDVPRVPKLFSDILDAVVAKAQQ